MREPRPWYCETRPLGRSLNITARVSIEQASTFGWSKYVGIGGHSIGMSSFGASAPLKDLQKKFGFTADKIVEAAQQQIRSEQTSS